MPKGYHHSARPATPRNATVPGPGNAAEDDILRAKQARFNLEPFTPEHSAAYAAFCGVTDRTTALTLHRNNITWDDVNDYSCLNGIASTDLSGMIALRQANLTPARTKAFIDMAARHHGNLTRPELIAFGSSGITPAQVEPFYAVSNAPSTWNASIVAAFIRAGISAEQAQEWYAVDIITCARATTLHAQGCEPSTVREYRQRTAPDTAFNEGKFVALYGSLRHAAANTDLARIALLNGVSAQHTGQWRRLDETLERVALFMQARISPDEWATDPAVRGTDNETLTMLAALHGCVAPLSGPELLASR